MTDINKIISINTFKDSKRIKQEQEDNVILTGAPFYNPELQMTIHVGFVEGTQDMRLLVRHGKTETMYTGDDWDHADGFYVIAPDEAKPPLPPSDH